METNWSRIWLDLRITILFLALTTTAGLGIVLIQKTGSKTVALLWALAALASGGLIGFLFGIPRVLQDSGAGAVVQAANDPTKPAPAVPAYRMQVNTNLEQISDWLTKIIVGIGLIELRNVPGYLDRLSLFMAGGLGNPTQSKVMAIALVLYFAILGFLGGYVMTRIYLAQAFSRADWGAQNTVIVAGEALTIAEASEQSRIFLGDLQDQILNLQKATPAAVAGAENIIEEGPENRAVAAPVRSILWVDDNPKNNSFVVERLTKLGITVTPVLSTSEALTQLRARSFDRIVSDMGRLETPGFNPKAGIDLLKAVHDLGIQTPFAFYCSAQAIAKYGQEALNLGAAEVTSSSTSLLQALKVEV